MNPKADWNSVVIQNGLQFGLGLVDQIDFMAEGDASQQDQEKERFAQVWNRIKDKNENNQKQIKVSILGTDYSWVPFA